MSAFKQGMRKLGVRAGLLAGASAAVLAISGLSAGSAMAVTEVTCPNSLNIAGKGSSLQRVAQEEWTGRVVPTTVGTPPYTKLSPERGYAKLCATPTVSYTSTSSGNGLGAFGFSGGTLDKTNAFISSDDGPNVTQISNSETASGTKPLIIPVAETSIAVVFNPPENCTVKSGAHGITYAQLGEVFGGKAIKTWAGLSSLVEGTGCTGAITRVVRAEGSGTTYQFKNYLAVLQEEGFGGPAMPCTLTGFNETTGLPVSTTAWKNMRFVGTNDEPNKVWPTPANCEGATTVETAAGGGALAEFVKNHHGTIGYAALPDAKGKGAMVAPLENTTLGTFGNPEASTGMKSNCGPRPYTVPTPGRANETGIAVNWSQVFGAEPSVAGSEYPLCTLTYSAAWNHYGTTGAKYSNSAETVAALRDYILKYVLSTEGQTVLNEHWYQELPHPAANATNVLGAAKKAAEQISN